MNISHFAQTILLSSSIEDKTSSPSSMSFDMGQNFELPRTFEFPGRPKELSLNRSSRPLKKFPADFSSKLARGYALHFFANHELLALELMALCLLKFPDAEQDFRRDIYHTMLEEQVHLRLYIQRMNELGCDLGDMPVNSFFWNTISTMKTPMDFSVRMSLTFEQANLDHAQYYRQKFHGVEDWKSSAIMQKVYEDEIKHVASGVKWCSKWKDDETDLFDLHESLLRLPLSVKRACGKVFDIDGRLGAGMPKSYIDKVKVYTRSKGQIPDIYVFNPDCELSFNEPSGKKQNQHVRALQRDLAYLTGFYAKSHDICVVSRHPPIEFLTLWKDLCFKLPEYFSSKTLDLTPTHTVDKIKSDRRVRDVVLWGANSSAGSRPAFSSGKNLFSKHLHANFISDFHREVSHRLIDRDDRHMAKKVSSHEQFHDAAASIFEDYESLFIKMDMGTAGSGCLKISKQDLDRKNIQDFLVNNLDTSSASSKGFLIEPYRERICDFSLASFGFNPGDRKTTDNSDLLRPICDHLGQYRGHFLGNPLSSLSEVVMKELMGFGDSVLSLRELILSKVRAYLDELSYDGPFGVDFYLYRAKSGRFFMQISEINVRHTMGHIALKLSKLPARQRGLWLCLPQASLSLETISKLGSYEVENDVMAVAPFYDDSKFCSFILKEQTLKGALTKLPNYLTPNSSDKFVNILDMLNRS